VASEDFSVFGRAWNVPYVFWFVGCADPQIYEQAKAKRQVNSIPSNHSPKFVPSHPTLRTWLETMLCAATE
jgi:hippurate hydrolase